MCSLLPLSLKTHWSVVPKVLGVRFPPPNNLTPPSPGGSRVREWGVGLAWGWREHEKARFLTPQVLGAPALVTTIEPKPTSRGPVTPARTGPHVPGPGSPGRTNPGLSPCLASLWPRRSGPRPRTSLGGCGSWFSVQRHRTPEIRLSVTGILAAL